MQQPGGGPEKIKADRIAYYRYVQNAGPRPSIMIMQDIDSRPGAGCWWGEVHSNLHQALGCVGVVTDGGVRDLDMIAPGFQFISATVVPSHAWVHLVDFDCDVDIYGMLTRSGDLIHADKHGAVIIPHAVARDVAAAAELCARREKPILDLCKSADFTVDKLERALSEASEIHRFKGHR